MLTGIEEIHIFYTLHTRYKKLGKYQFSCHGKHALYNSSAWCHNCPKCARNFLFAIALGIDPSKVGFEKDMLAQKNIFDEYFNGIPGYDRDIDFSFFLLLKKNPQHYYSKLFKKKMLPNIRSWNWYKKHFLSLHSTDNLPLTYKNRVISIFKNQ